MDFNNDESGDNSLKVTVKVGASWSPEPEAL